MAMFIRVDVNGGVVQKTPGLAQKLVESCPVKIFKPGAAENTVAVVEDNVDIHLPIKVRIDAGNVGGPSAGLAFALEVMQQLGRNVTHGHDVAATGELAANVAVEPIGGIKQKTIGVREAGADVFLVPAGDNAAEARKEAGGLRIIPVKTFPQALHALATLPPKQ